MKNKAEYAIYKKDNLLFMGTVEEISNYFNVKKETVYYWASSANKKRADTGIRPGRKPRKKECSGVKVAVKII